VVNSRVVLAGNSLAATYALDLLLEVCDRRDILTIAPEPDRVAAWHVSLEAAALGAGVECISPVDVNAPEVIERIREHEPALLLSVYYTQIFSTPILGSVDGPLLNFHPSLLPRHRGTAPLIWAIVEGDSVTGVTVHHLDEGVDTGRVVLQHPLPIHWDDTGYQLHLKTAKLVRSTAAEIIQLWVAGEHIPSGQLQTGEASYHSTRDPQVNHLEWHVDRKRIRDTVRALAPPLPGAFAYVESQPLVIASVEPIDAVGLRPKPHGMLELAHRGAPIVWAADGPLRIHSFVDEGHLWPGSELSNRRPVKEGQILG
jgi:methionyl-tRNA formyltransferase